MAFDPRSEMLFAGGGPAQAAFGNAPPSPAVVMPAVLEALLRKAAMARDPLQDQYNDFAASNNAMGEDQARYYAERMGAADPFPIGQEFTNQGSQQRFTHAVPSGSLGSISGRIAGIGPSMNTPAPQADPMQTLIMHINNAANGNLNYAGLDGNINMVQKANLIDDPNRQIEIGGPGGANSKLGVIDKAQYAKHRAGVQASDQAKTDLLAQRGIARGEAANNRRMGHDPRLAALLATLGAQGGGGDMGQMLLGDAIGGRGAGLGLMTERRLAETARGEKESFDKRTSVMDKSQGGAAIPGAPSGEDPARTAIKQTATKVYQQGLQDYSDPNRAAGAAFNHLRSTTPMPVAEIYKIIREATGVDLETVERDTKRRIEAPKRRASEPSGESMAPSI